MTRRGRARTRRETVLVVDMGAWAAQPTARSLARAGFRVLAAGVGGRVAGRSRYFTERHVIPPALEQEAFAERIERICARERVDVVVPLTDEILGGLLFGPASGGPWAVVGPTAEQFTRFCDKAVLLETAAAAGLASPASTVVTPAGVSGPLPPLPAYVKVVSGPDAGRAVPRPVRVGDAESCEREVRRLVERGEVVLIQEEVVGRQLRFHFVRRHGKMAHLAARTLANYPFRVGQSTVSQFLPSPPELVEVSVALLEAGGYEGAGVIQYVERGGVWYVHDVNLRMPSSVDATIAAGLDMPRFAVEIALGRVPDLASARPRPLRHVQLNGEVLALRDALGGVCVGRSAARIAAGLAVAVVAPGRQLAPLDVTDPLPTLAALTAARRGSPRQLPSAPDPAQPAKSA
ncbi:ATP-grasp domain-containing protein [Gaiella occulta]|uniref:ATP-grasp domain-containing protein n=1 Tax=Gaiella occulta TaxID=1002870 RepID=A0A7M2Z0M6_9ACTN|nr:ATP-grasp domain-containing protein [Gaiella occulta]RDI75351.1 ATP-grasp domain-containing protein [Gaiella occulta]